MSGYVPPATFQYLSDSGVPLAGGKVYTYAAGTSTPLATYSDVALAVPNANPIILDSGGRCTMFVAGGVAYKRVVKTSTDVLVLTEDNIQVPSFTTPAVPDGVPTGVMFPYGAAAAPTGYLLCDGSSYVIATYPALSAAIRTVFGGADASHFYVPDIRQRVVLGLAASGTGSTIGGTIGNIDHTHTGPSHVHPGPSHHHAVSDPFSDRAEANDRIGVDTDTLCWKNQAGDWKKYDASVVGASTPGRGIYFAGDTTDTGTGNTGAGGTAASGAGNPPAIALPWIIKT